MCGGGGVSVTTYWAAKWSQTNILDGRREHLILFDWKEKPRRPLLFRTRRECRAFIEREYGYIRKRKDLLNEPHCWRVPRAVKVEVRELQ